MKAGMVLGNGINKTIEFGENLGNKEYRKELMDDFGKGFKKTVKEADKFIDTTKDKMDKKAKYF